MGAYVKWSLPPDRLYLVTEMIYMVSYWLLELDLSDRRLHIRLCAHRRTCFGRPKSEP